MRNRLISLLAFFFLTPLLIAATTKAQTEVLELPEGAIRKVIAQTAMPELDDTPLGRVLTRFYNNGVGGQEKWDAVESIRASGQLLMEAGEFDFSATQKKPHFLKMSLSRNNMELLMAYDGKDAWQVRPGPEKNLKPELMDGAQARRFINGTQFGSHLLFPFAPGKKIELIDTAVVDGTICHHVRVTLKSGYQTDHFIDVRSDLEFVVRSTDLETGTNTEMKFYDYFRIEGLPYAKKVVTKEDGKWVSDLVIEEVKLNQGVMPWFFKMPE